MDKNREVERLSTNPDVKAGVRAYLMKGMVAKLVMALILGLSSGRWNWVNGWMLFGIYTTWDVVVALLLIPRSPEMIAERARIQEGTKTWDIVLATLAASLMPMATWIVAGLDERYRWTTQLSLSLQIAAMVIVVLGFVLVTWAMAANEFFSTMVRIQEDRGQTVATSGPYQYVRHPGYVGAIMFQLATPIMLSSLWALIPSGLSVLFYIIRTALEDHTLQDELRGYKEYAGKVRYRLLPGIW
jgi:protein-S-isoprenylcysteine O-methyltransferase Ste14